MELINNTTKTLKDDLKVEIKEGSKISIAANEKREARVLYSQIKS